jgi:hypothetical protein
MFPHATLPSRFYFDLTNGQSNIRDAESVRLTDLAEAIREARSVLEEMRRSDELSEDEEGWFLIIRDAAGEALMTLPVVPARFGAGDRHVAGAVRIDARFFVSNARPVPPLDTPSDPNG